MKNQNKKHLYYIKILNIKELCFIKIKNCFGIKLKSYFKYFILFNLKDKIQNFQMIFIYMIKCLTKKFQELIYKGNNFIWVDS